MIKKVMINPPIKKPATATNDGNCKSDKPDMACPEVQPLAQRVPKPIKKPPTIKMAIFFKVNVWKISEGSND